MSPKTILKIIKERYPELSDLPKTKLRIVEKAVVEATKLASLHEKYDLLSSEEHEAFMEEIVPGGMTPGKSLKAYRFRSEWTQQELAKRSGISQANISAMERDRRPIGLKVAKKLAKILNCRYDRFLS